jgi:hypothetical protein
LTDEKINHENILYNIRRFFNESLLNIWSTIPQEIIFNAWQELGLKNFFKDVMPNIGFYDFVKKIREE